MPRVSLTALKHAALGVTALAGAVFAPTSYSQAADLFYEPGRYAAPPAGYYEPVEPREPIYQRPVRPYRAPIAHGRYDDDGICRVFHKRRIDAYGREVIHRVRICDEGPVQRGPGWAQAAPPQYGYGPAPAPYYGRQAVPVEPEEPYED